MGLPGWLNGKEPASSAGDSDSIPGVGRSPGEGNDYLFQYSCLENPMHRGAWGATVYGVAKSQTWLSDWITKTTSVHRTLHKNVGRVSHRCVGPREKDFLNSPIYIKIWIIWNQCISTILVTQSQESYEWNLSSNCNENECIHYINILLIFYSNDNTISIAAMIRVEVVCSHFPGSIQFLRGSDWRIEWIQGKNRASQVVKNLPAVQEI